MSATIRPVGSSASNYVKPQLLNKIDTQNVEVNMAVFIPKEDGIIGVCEDRSVRIWLKRDNGQYWPSVCQFLPSAATAVDYNNEHRRLFVGCDNGTISEYDVAEDFNSIQHRRDYLAHTGRITAVLFASQSDWILSCARDKYMSWHCTQSGKRCGGYLASGWCTCLQYDPATKYVFLGDYTGVINILKLSSDNLEVINTLKGHQGSVRALVWDVPRSKLCSASFDRSVIVWDIGGGKGVAYELQGHRDKVEALTLAAQAKQLISAGDDSNIVFWKMNVPREETPAWTEGDTCVRCQLPFFWNVRKMWEERKVGVRQHHCRKCGEVVCDKCSDYRTTFPPMGFEYPVRVCQECYQGVEESSLRPLAAMADSKHQVLYLSIDESRQQLLSVGRDRLIKIWDISSILKQDN